MKIGIISDIHLGSEKLKNGANRKLSRHSKKFVEIFVDKMNKKIKPDFVIQLGDVIEDRDRITDKKNFKIGLAELNKLNYLLYHVIGNHDTWKLNKRDLTVLIKKPELYYSFDCGDFNCVVLFSEHFKTNPERVLIDDEQINWLKKELQKTDKKVIIFSHHALADVDLSNSWWFADKPEGALVKNRRQIRKILEESGKVQAVINGHVHLNDMTVHNNIPYFTIQSLIENFNNDNIASESYAVAEIDEEKITVQIFGNQTAKYNYKFN